ncbi:MAG: acetate kinase, partial [Pirellulales bacterium]|nr:acetate kinase [Pirellulales bacterium]
MSILVVNCGSTSLRASVVDPQSGQRLGQLEAERLNTPEAKITILDAQQSISPPTHAEVMRVGLPQLLVRLPAGAEIVAVGHRIVQGGGKFKSPILVDDAVESSIEFLSHLAPIHTPANIAGIRAAGELFPDLPHVAVFDTAFHHTIPPRAHTYAIPRWLAEKHDLRRYGFHGTSHQFVAGRVAEFLGEDLRHLRIISCHLGGGCSVCAVEYGRSVETSMGMTPLEGLVMGSRSGDIDPGALIHLIRAEGMTPNELDELLNRQSGLAGLSGLGSDLRDIERRAEEGDDACRLAIQVFCHRLRKYIGAYTAVMGGVDAIVFTAGIGQNSAVVRHRVAQRLDFLGARLDEERNRGVGVSSASPVAVISTEHSRTKLLVAQTDEALSIARQTAELIRTRPTAIPKRQIPVAISARHV